MLGYDPFPSPGFEALGAPVALPELLAAADIVSLHCPLLPTTHHLIDGPAIALMKPGAMLVNTARGALIDTCAVIAALESRQLGALAIDVYEQESELYFQDQSADAIADDVFERLMTFPNVLVTGQGFFLRLKRCARLRRRPSITWRASCPARGCLNIVPGTAQRS